MVEIVAKERWQILRNAILKTKKSNNPSSIHRFDGFSEKLFPHLTKSAYRNRACYHIVHNTPTAFYVKLIWKRNRVLIEKQNIEIAIHSTSPLSMAKAVELANILQQQHPFQIQHLFTRASPMGLSIILAFDQQENDCPFYRIDYRLDNSHFTIRETNQANHIVSLQQLASGISSQSNTKPIDNTGNVRTWPCAQVLLYYFLNHHKNSFQRKSICELGAGMAGLVGLGITCCLNRSQNILPPKRVMLTDGNNAAVENLKLCIKENADERNYNPRETNLEAMLLHWNQADEEKQDGDLNKSFDFLLASDCLFFEDFHLDLLNRMQQLLVDSPQARCFFLQPSRGGSMERFLTIVQHQNVFSAHISYDYDPIISQLHEEFSSDPLYDKSIHYPVLVTLKWKKYRIHNS